MKCQKCGAEIFLPFRCPYCGDYFCSEHRLPENHTCPQMELARVPKTQVPRAIVQRQKPYEYEVTYAPTKHFGKIRFSGKEIQHLAVATLLVMAIGLSPILYVPIEPSYLAFFTLMLTASFFIHEMAHKITAQKRGLWAEFRLIIAGAVLTLISVILPPYFFKIISPGAVMVGGHTDRKNMGKISIAGPLTNIILSTIFLTGAFLNQQYPMATLVLTLGAAFNAWIALLNLIPFGMFDGFKIFLWNKTVWALTFSASLVLAFISSYYL